MDNDTMIYLIIIVGIILSTITAIMYLKLTTNQQKTTIEKSVKKETGLITKIKKLGWQDDLGKHNWGISFREYVFISGCALLIMILVGIALKNVFVAISGGLIAYMLPRYIIKRNRKKEYKLKVKLLKPALQSVASAHTFKPNIISAIQHAISSMSDPIKKDFELFIMDVEMGMSAREALEYLRKRVNIKYLDFFVKVAIMAEEEGGATHDLIKTCAEIIDQDVIVMEEFETEILAEKRQGTTLLLLQFVMLGFLGITQPHAFQAFTTTWYGQMYVLYLLFSTFIAYQFIEKLTDISLEEINQ